mgnify:CR=1 FL=1
MTPIDNLLLGGLLVFATDVEGSDIKQFIDVIHKGDWDDWINKYQHSLDTVCGMRYHQLDTSCGKEGYISIIGVAR